jgi:ferredoxin
LPLLKLAKFTSLRESKCSGHGNCSNMCATFFGVAF